MSLINRYELQFKETYPTIFEKLAYLRGAFGGTVEIVDGVSNNENMFTIKTKIDSVVLGDYNTDANTGMGTGTAKSSRFGNIHENKWKNTQVPYTGTYAWNEAIDLHTVNNDPAKALAEITSEVAELLNDKYTERFAKSLVDNAGKELSMTAVDADNVIKAFDDAKTEFANNRIRKGVARRAYVKDGIENILVNAGLLTTAKNSTVNLDAGNVYVFKGFIIEVVPDSFFPENVDIIFAVDGVGHSFLGIETVRTLNLVEDFDGSLYQGALKYGDYIPEENKKGIIIAKSSVGRSKDK